MASSEKFCLKWNDFEHNVSSAFNDIREEKDFFDVTLVCENNQVQAHKVIIAACSPFFKTILRRNPHQHPLLYMKGVLYDDLVSVLNFMYKGEVNVAQEQLNSFLAVAEDLQVKGLTQSNNDNKESKSNISSKPSSSSSQYPPIKKPKVSNSGSYSVAASGNSQYQSSSAGVGGQIDSVDADDDIQEVVPVKTEPAAAVSHLQTQESESESMPAQVEEGGYTEEGYEGYEGFEGYEGYDTSQYADYDNSAELAKGIENTIEENMVKDGGTWFCQVCPFQSGRKSHMQGHIEAKHLSHDGYLCQTCNKTYKTKNSFRVHAIRCNKNKN